MKWNSVVLCALSVVSARAQEVPALSNQPGGPVSFRPLLFDVDLTMRSCTETVVTLQQGLARVEDKFLRTRWFDETGVLRKTGGAAGRLAKVALLDAPVDHFLVILTHEYTGHGARYRELDISSIDYGYDWPPPYGSGGGHASADIGAGEITSDELIAIWTGGVESHRVLNGTLGLQWTTQRRMSYRDALLYFKSWVIAQTYIDGTEATPAPQEHGNDLNAYVDLMNAKAGYNDPSNLRMTVDDLKTRTRLNMLDPMLFASMYALAKTYLWDGNTSNELSMLPVGPVGYLPGLRVGFTPFGFEYRVDNYLRFGRRAALIDVRVGDTTFYDGWGGVGVSVRNLYERKRASIDANLDLWKQPGLELSGTPAGLKGLGFGGAASVRGYFGLGRRDKCVSAVVELGYKSAGFLEGHPLDAAPIVTAGVAVR